MTGFLRRWSPNIPADCNRDAWKNCRSVVLVLRVELYSKLSFMMWGKREEPLPPIVAVGRDPHLIIPRCMEKRRAAHTMYPFAVNKIPVDVKFADRLRK